MEFITAYSIQVGNERTTHTLFKGDRGVILEHRGHKADPSEDSASLTDWDRDALVLHKPISPRAKRESGRLLSHRGDEFSAALGQDIEKCYIVDWTNSDGVSQMGIERSEELLDQIRQELHALAA
jgi:hypothetical protein